MSRNVIINTPLPIKVGRRAYRLITLEDLYVICRGNIALFEQIAAEPGRLGEILLEQGLVLPSACLNFLASLLRNEKLVALAREHLGKRRPWPTRGVLYWGRGTGSAPPPCTWPDCPPTAGLPERSGGIPAGRGR